MDDMDRLLTAATASIGEPVSVDEGGRRLERWGQPGMELATLLALRNGFYAYGGALLIRPMSNTGCPRGLVQWNQATLWRDEYAGDFGLGDSLFFGEDVFGEQYCIANSRVCLFQPESGALKDVGDSLAHLIALIVGEPNVVTGYPLLREWESQNGRLAAGMRLLPKVPFIVGGEYAPENLYASSDVDGMKFRASIANQIKDLPDGAQIVLGVDGSRKPD